MVGQGLQWVAFDLPSSQSRDAAVGRPGVVLVADAMAGRPGGRLAGAEQPVRSRLLGRQRVAAVGQPADRARGRWRTLPTWADLAFGLDSSCHSDCSARAVAAVRVAVRAVGSWLAVLVRLQHPR